MKNRILGWLLLILGAANVTLAQGYRGIKPMESTCVDVKRILGVQTCEPLNNTYQFESESLRINFSKVTCEKAWGKYWNIPRGTVLSIERILKQPIPLSDLKLDLSTYEKGHTDVLEQVILMSKVDGMSLWLTDTQVKIIVYGPKSKDEYLLCNDPPACDPDHQEIALPTRWYDRYGDLSFRDERKHLDNLANEIQTYPETTQVYIVAYPDRRIGKATSTKRAERAMNYLLNSHAIAPSRIRIVTGEYRDEFEIVIYIVPFESR